MFETKGALESQLKIEPVMTLRDYFAAQAMQGFATNPDWGFPDGAIGMAVTAYAWADAMLKERKA
jgi:hypothetical protein